MRVKINIDIAVISGNTKEFLEQFDTGVEFTQRKNYDEYYTKTICGVDVSMEILSLISERLKVEIQGDEIRISEY